MLFPANASASGTASRYPGKPGLFERRLDAIIEDILRTSRAHCNAFRSAGQTIRIPGAAPLCAKIEPLLHFVKQSMNTLGDLI